MPRFFVEANMISDGCVTVTGDDAHHISRALRMAAGEHITVCDTEANVYDCVLEDFLPDRVRARIVGVAENDAEPKFRIRLYQGLPKGDKLDTVIQKAVECGAAEIVPFESEFCVMHAKSDSEDKKTERRNRIALEAAKQSRRGCIPTVRKTVRFSDMVAELESEDLVLFCYEGDETHSIKSVLEENKVALISAGNVSVIVGSEGGFSPAEAEILMNAGAKSTGLGKRILRTETAATFALACISYATEM